MKKGVGLLPLLRNHAPRREASEYYRGSPEENPQINRLGPRGVLSPRPRLQRSSRVKSSLVYTNIHLFRWRPDISKVLSF